MEGLIFFIFGIIAIYLLVSNREENGNEAINEIWTRIYGNRPRTSSIEKLKNDIIEEITTLEKENNELRKKQNN